MSIDPNTYYEDAGFDTQPTELTDEELDDISLFERMPTEVQS